MSSNRVIGINNSLPWKIPEDLKYFKAMTLKRKVVMGKNTFNSIGILPNREIYVISSNPTEEMKRQAELKEIIILKDVKSIPHDSIICGGANLYNQTLEMCSNLFLTVINKHFEGDTFMPIFETDFLLTNSTHFESKSGIRVEFRHYMNKIIYGL